MSDIKTAALRAAAEAATPGPWHWDSDEVKNDPTGRVRYQITTTGKTVAKIYYSSYEGGPTNAEDDAKFIALANPAAILALLDQLREREQYYFERCGEKLEDALIIHNSQPDKELMMAAPVPLDGERNFYERCGKRLGNTSHVHTCTPPATRPTDDELLDQTLQERDRYHETADNFAEAISKYFNADIWEHSSINCPWDQALEIIENATPVDAQKARDDALEEAAKIVNRYANCDHIVNAIRAIKSKHTI